MNNLTIKPYKDSDYARVSKILMQAKLFYAPWDSKESLKRKTRIFPGSVIIAANGKQIIGCVYVLTEIGGFICQLAVKKEFRGKGVGSSLLNAAEDYLIKNKVHEWILWTYDEREDLHNYYIKRGYRKRGKYSFFTKTDKSSDSAVKHEAPR